MHQSAKDFLVEKASSEIFSSGMEEVHHVIFFHWLEALALLGGFPEGIVAMS